MPRSGSAKILTVNMGSSSLRAGSYDRAGEHLIWAAEFERIGQTEGTLNVFDADQQSQIEVSLPLPTHETAFDVLRDRLAGSDTYGFSHQGPGLIDVMLSKRGTVSRIYLPPDANCLLSVADHCLRSRNYVNLMVDKPVIFAFHGYQRALHEVIHGRVNAERFHVRGFSEQGTTTTPFDMLVLNEMSRYHLAKAALQRATRIRPRVPTLLAELDNLIAKAVSYTREHLEDPPDIRDWTWNR